MICLVIIGAINDKSDKKRSMPDDSLNLPHRIEKYREINYL